MAISLLKRRPYRAVPLAELIAELTAREVLAELSIQQVLPVMPITTEAETAVKMSVFRSMIARLGPALAESDFMFTGEGSVPGGGRALIIKLFALKHPMRPGRIIDADPGLVPAEGA